jgi:hypothetical protein
VVDSSKEANGEGEAEMRRLIITLFCLFIGTNVLAADLDAAGSQVIKAAGVQIYPGAEFINGNQDVGYRFASTKSQDDVRAWYKKQLSAWALYEEYGGWILYDGKPGAGMSELMSKNQVSVKENKMLHDWFGVDQALSTEIVIMIPKQ